MRQLTLPSLYPQKRRRTDSSGNGSGRSIVTRGATRVPVRRPRGFTIKHRAPRWLIGLFRPRTAMATAAAGLAVIAATVAVVGAGGPAAMGEAAESRLVAWSGSLGLAVGEVLVEGRRETPAAEVLAALQVRYGTPLFAFSPQEARDRLLRIGWVRDARIERRLPGTIFVDLDERSPAAIWQHRGDFSLVDAGGAVIGSEDVGRFTGLRLVVGDDAPAHFATLFEILNAEPDIARKVTAAVRVGGRRWNLQFDNGITVLLPESGVAEAWATLAKLAREDALLDRDIARIDMRIPDRMIVRLSPEAAQARGERGA